MASRAPAPAPRDETTRLLDGGFWLVVILAGGCALLLVLSLALGASSPGTGAAGSVAAIGASPSSSVPVDPATFLSDDPVGAPALDLTAPDGARFSLASLRGSPTFVFFGYTHCPDVCPATTGIIGEVLAGAPDLDARAVFVTIDPDRDTPAWLGEYTRYLPEGFVAVTGSPAEIASTAEAWDVRYAKVDTGDPSGYSMSHSAEVRLIDGAGMIRAIFPFGTTREQMATVLRDVVATPLASPAAPSASVAPSLSAEPPGSTSPSVGAAGALSIRVVSSSVWAGPPSPIILTLSRGGTALDDPALHPTVQLRALDGSPVGAPAEAVPVQPPGVATVSYVASPAIPGAGLWHLEVSTTGADAATGSADVRALDPGMTAPIGAPAPPVRTPTLADVGGLAKAVTTDPAPDLRLSQTSTADALAAGKPFVLVIDSTKFRVSPACGRAVVMARYLVDRWPGVPFIHLEPYRYQVITDTPVLDGSLTDPTLTDPAAAWGIGGMPWGPRSMPWTFVVDGHGTVRARYQGVMGSDDIDVIVAMIEAGD
jgi:protein SCO1